MELPTVELIGLAGRAAAHCSSPVCKRGPVRNTDLWMIRLVLILCMQALCCYATGAGAGAMAEKDADANAPGMCVCTKYKSNVSIVSTPP